MSLSLKDAVCGGLLEVLSHSNLVNFRCPYLNPNRWDMSQVNPVYNCLLFTVDNYERDLFPLH